MRQITTRIGRIFGRVLATTLALLLVTTTTLSPVAYADYGDAPESILRSLGIYFTTNTGIAECGAGGNANAGGVSVSASETDIAKTIMGIAKSAGFGDKSYKAAVIGVMTAITESRLAIWASAKIPISKQNPAWIASPKQLVGNDHYSVGVFQQQVGTPDRPFGWGTITPESRESKEAVWQLMDPAYGAQSFFTNHKLGSNGLKYVPNWDTIDPWMAAQKVQKSFDPAGGNYKANFAKAVSLVEKYWASAAPVPLPAPLSGSNDNAPPSNAGNITAETSCPEETAGTGTADGPIFSYVEKYAWPKYRGTGYMTMKPAYITATKAAQNRGEYIGGCAGVDCGAFITRVMRDSGADPDYNKFESSTSLQLRYLEGSSLYEEVRGVTGTQDLEPGDIAIRPGHTYMYIGKAIPSFEQNSASASLCSRSPMSSSAYDFTGYHWFRKKAQRVVGAV